MRASLFGYGLIFSILAGCNSTTAPTPETHAPKELSKSGIQLINQSRKANGLSTLKASQRLNRVAQLHANEVERRGYGLRSTFNVHRSLDGSGITDRINKSGYRSCLSVENAAWGQKDTNEVVRDWIVSDDHRFNTFHPKITHIGMAKSGKVWIMVGSKPCKGERP